MIVVYLLLLMLKFLGELVSLALETLSFTLVHGGLSHAGALTIAVSTGLVHLFRGIK